MATCHQLRWSEKAISQHRHRCVSHRLTNIVAAFSQYNEFICSSKALTPGTLADTDPYSNGIVIFLGLLGVHTLENMKQHSCPHAPHQYRHLTH